MDAFHDYIMLFEDWHHDSLVALAALDLAIAGNGDLRAGGFSCLGCALTECCGSFLQVL